MSFSKKIKELKEIQLQADLLNKKSEKFLLELKKNIKNKFKEDLRRKINKPIRIKFGDLWFGHKKNNQDPPEMLIKSINDHLPGLDGKWQVCYGINEPFDKVPISVKWFEQFLLNISEEYGVKFSVSRTSISQNVTDVVD
jgi:hypothetical protein